MANELSANYNGTATLYAILRRQSDGYVYNGSTFVEWDDADIADYDIPLTAMGGDWYAANLPSIDAGNYRADYYVQDGGSPATTDLRIDGGAFYWNGVSASYPVLSATGYYADGDDLLDRFGTVQVNTLSNLDNTSTSADENRLGKALAYADSRIDLHVRSNGYTVPVATTAADFDKLTEIACHFAMAWLYDRRAFRSSEDKGSMDERERHEKIGTDQLYALLIRGMDAARHTDDPTFGMVVV